MQQRTCIKSIKFAHLSNSRLVPFVLFSKREEKRKKERYSNFSPTRSILSFHVQLISGRAFHSLKAETREKESERERDESISRHRRQKGAMTSRGHTQVSSAACIVARVVRSPMHFRAPDMKA